MSIFMSPDWEEIGKQLAGWGVDALSLRDAPELQNCEPGDVIIVAEPKPRQAVAWIFAALARDLQVFVADPNWGEDRWNRLLEVIRPDVGVGAVFRERSHNSGASGTPPDSPHRGRKSHGLAIPTGGTTGGLRFTLHNWETLSAAARAYGEFFGEFEHIALTALPMHHISGLMPVVRGLVLPGRVRFARIDANGPLPIPADPNGETLSLVPTMLTRLLRRADAKTWLRGFRTILLGGAAAPGNLLDESRELGLRLAPCYGMSETAALISALRPDEFLDGESGVGRPLPHAEVFIRDEGGLPVERGRRGRIIVQTSSLCLGLCPGDAIPHGDGYATGDAGYLDIRGHLHVTGRLDRVINSGGEKVDPAEVERVIMATELVKEVYVTGLPDPEWGEAVTAFYIPEEGTDAEALKLEVRESLAPFQRPRDWVAVKEIPRNAVGKVEMEALTRGRT